MFSGGGYVDAKSIPRTVLGAVDYSSDGASRQGVERRMHFSLVRIPILG